MESSSALSQINWVGVIVAALAAFPLGALWYGPLFQKRWMTVAGVSPSPGGDAGRVKTYAAALVLNLVVATSLALFIGPEAGWSFGLFAGLMAGFTFVAMALGVIYLFERRPFALWAINAGYQVVVFSVMGIVLGVW